MRKRTSAMAVAVVLAGASAVGLACGDKFLVPGRGVRYAGRAPMREGATILLFVRPGSAMEAAFRASNVEARLRSAGYKPMLVSSDEQFAAAARSGSWDVVVADLMDAVTMPAAASSSSVLPVAHEAAKTSLDATRRQYRHVVVVPAKGQAVVDAVDAVMADRAAQAKDRKKAGA
jgi:hypothetical protein